MQFHNVTIDFSVYTHAEFSGESCYSVPLSMVRSALDYWRQEDCNHGTIEELEERMEDAEGDTVALYDTDILIQLLHVVAYELPQTEKYRIEWQSDHVIWVFHDLYHVKHDTDATGEQSIDDSAEYECVRQSIDACVANKVPVPMHIIRQTDEEFRDRFGWSADFEEYASQHHTPIDYASISLAHYEE